MLILTVIGAGGLRYTTVRIGDEHPLGGPMMKVKIVPSCGSLRVVVAAAHEAHADLGNPVTL
ncbi:MAG: hypothetical protein ACRDSH_19930 [Pseudonocardiaceae bacterium]